MMPAVPSTTLSSLRELVAAVPVASAGTLAFGVEALDRQLAGEGLALGGLHEIAPASATLADDAAATLFAVGVAARAAAAGRRVLWAVTRFDLYAPGLEQAGLAAAAVLFAQGADDQQVLAVMEDGLRHGSLACVVGEVRRADMVALRRLQLAAGAGGAPALLVRRWRRQGVCPLAEPSVALTRWRIGCAPSAPLPAAGVGRARWTVDLVRQRGGAPFSLLLEACDDTGRLALPAQPRHRAAAPVGAAARAA